MTDLSKPREFKVPEVPIVGNQPSIELWHGKPNVWGKNPQGWPMYRVIRSESRYYLLGGRWGDNGRVEYRWAPYYAGRKEWVLEKWLTPEEFAGTEVQWNIDNALHADPNCPHCWGGGVIIRRGEEVRCHCDLAAQGILIFTMGPYPRLGWYEHCFTFPADGDPNLECIVPLLEASKDLSLARIKQGLSACHAQMRKDWENRFESIVDDAQGAFHNRASNVNPGKVTPDRVTIGNEQEFRAALAKQKNQKVPEPTQTPEEMNLPDHGFAIKQRR